MPGLTQVRLTLEQAGSRRGPDLIPAYEDKEVAVRGQVSSRPVLTPAGDLNTYYLPIQDEASYGLLLQGDAARFNAVQPGDWIEVTGTLERRAGMPVLLPREISVTVHAATPAPKELRLEALNSFRYLGVLVTTGSRIAVTAEDNGGEMVWLADRENRIRVFLPRMRRSAKNGLEGYRSGDLVRATGIATQHCTLPPYDRAYEILLPNSSSVVLLAKAWLFPPSIVLTAVLVILILLVLLSLRERYIARQRRTLRSLNAVGEDVIGSASPEIVRKLMGVLPKLLHLSGAGIFAANRQTQTIESFYGEGSASEYTDKKPPASPIFEAASAAFRNRTPLSVPDSRRSPFFAAQTRAPRSALFVPMFAQAELVGVLELEWSGHIHHCGEEEQAALQHLANQVAAALKLQEQQSIREQVFRTEKLASAAQLMSGIANELRLPLDSIATCLDVLRSRDGAVEPLLSTIGAETHRAREIVQRLLAFSRADQVEAEPVDLNEIVLEVADLHAAALRSRNIAVRRRLSNQTLIALGSREQLAQVILNLLIYAEQSLADWRGSSEIRITSAMLARRALIEVSWPARGADVDPDRGAADLIEKTGLSLEVCHGIVQSHGGELRVSQSGSDVRFELDLPVIEARRGAGALEQSDDDSARRQLTILVVEPEAGSQRHVVSTFSGLGHRVVPVASAEEGADLAERMRFDVVVCAVRLPGLSWAGFLERVRGQVGGVILLTDAYDPNLMRTFQSSDVFVVNKPADPAEIKHLCEVIAESPTFVTVSRP
jgi:signal transduction histidine kinase